MAERRRAGRPAGWPVRAHGVLAVVAAYMGWVLVETTGINPWLTIVIVVPVMAAIGYALQMGLLNPALGRGGLAPILVTFGLAVVITNLLQQFFSAAQLMGIDNKRIYAIATAIALGFVGLAGIFLGMRTQFSPTYGDATLIFAFEAVIIGGLGSLWGTLIGGMVLGIAQAVGAQVNPAWGILVGNLVFLAILAFRPTGLLQKAVNS